MKNMLFSAEPILELNQLVQDKIASHLFLCCNYNPLSVAGLNNDGKFYPAIVNLYRIVSDSSCIIKRLSKFRCAIINNPDTAKQLNKAIDTVDMLRSVVAHNNSMHNGRREAERLDDYHCWVQKIIGKREPSCPEDYSTLLAELQEIAANLYALLEEYILAAATHPSKSTIIAEWESYIIDWYCGKNVKRDIFMGVLEDEYLSRLPLTNVDSYMGYRVARWIQNYYTKETQIENLRKISKELETDQLNAPINTMQQIADDLISATASEFGTIAPYCFVDKFFVELKGHLLHTLQSEKCSMLPDVLLQKQIQLLFDSVSIPSC